MGAARRVAGPALGDDPTGRAFARGVGRRLGPDRPVARRPRDGPARGCACGRCDPIAEWERAEDVRSSRARAGIGLGRGRHAIPRALLAAGFRRGPGRVGAGRGDPGRPRPGRVVDVTPPEMNTGSDIGMVWLNLMESVATPQVATR